MSLMFIIEISTFDVITSDCTYLSQVVVLIYTVDSQELALAQLEQFARACLRKVGVTLEENIWKREVAISMEAFEGLMEHLTI